MNAPLSADAQALLAAITGSRRTRWRLEDLEEQQIRALPHLRGRPDSRRELASALGELTRSGRVSPSKKQDRTRMPALPAFIDVVRDPSNNSQRADTKGHGWRPELAAGVRALAPAPTPAELRILKQTNRWLADHHEEPPGVCGSRERSLEVFGDEKLLDERLRYGRLFGSGLLSYELLRARRVAPGLVTEFVGDVPAALVVENADTFRTVADELRRRASTRVGVVAWGAGAAFEQSCEALATVTVAGQRLERCWYFGDVDPSGLRIPARAAVTVHPLDLQPARPLYELLLALDCCVGARERMTDETAEHLRWLGEPLAERARAVMRAGMRLPQEAVTASVVAAAAALV